MLSRASAFGVGCLRDLCYSNRKAERVGSSMVEQRPFKALVVGSSPTRPTARRLMAWVYIVRGSSGRHYIGSTENLPRRLEEHGRGGAHTTRRLGPELTVAASKNSAPSLQRVESSANSSTRRTRSSRFTLSTLAMAEEQRRKRSLAKAFGVRRWLWVRVPPDPALSLREAIVETGEKMRDGLLRFIAHVGEAEGLAF